MFQKRLKMIYSILLLDICLTIYFIYTQGYNYDNMLFILLFKSLILLVFIKLSIISIIYYINNYTRIFLNRYFYILLKLYILLTIYINTTQIMEVI